MNLQMTEMTEPLGLLQGWLIFQFFSLKELGFDLIASMANN